jgi:hypothetical protein
MAAVVLAVHLLLETGAPVYFFFFSSSFTAASIVYDVMRRQPIGWLGCAAVYQLSHSGGKTTAHRRTHDDNNKQQKRVDKGTRGRRRRISGKEVHTRKAGKTSLWRQSKKLSSPSDVRKVAPCIESRVK